MDECFEALTLIQTMKIRPFPVIMVDKAFWSGLWDWVRGHLTKEGMVSPADLELFTFIDDPNDIAERVIECIQTSCYEEGWPYKRRTP